MGIPMGIPCTVTCLGLSLSLSYRHIAANAAMLSSEFVYLRVYSQAFHPTNKHFYDTLTTGRRHSEPSNNNDNNNKRNMMKIGLWVVKSSSYKKCLIAFGFSFWQSKQLSLCSRLIDSHFLSGCKTRCILARITIERVCNDWNLYCSGNAVTLAWVFQLSPLDTNQIQNGLSECP